MAGSFLFGAALFLGFVSLNGSAQSPDELHRWLKDMLTTPTETHKFHVGSSPVSLRIYRLNDPTASRYGLTLVFATLPANSYKLSIKDIRQQEDPRTTFSRVAHKDDDLILINGGFWDISNDHVHPMGLLISHGQQLNKLRRWHSGGVLYASKQSVCQIAAIRNFRASPAIQEAIQSKLLLVESSRPGIYSDDHELANRTAIGLREDGSILIAGAFNDSNQALSLYEFAKVLVHFREPTSARLSYAIYMDGGPSAHIFIPALNLHFGSEGGTFVPNLVRFSVQHE